LSCALPISANRRSSSLTCGGEFQSALICAAGNLAKIYTATGNVFLALGEYVNAAYYFGLAEGVVSAAC